MAAWPLGLQFCPFHPFSNWVILSKAGTRHSLQKNFHDVLWQQPIMGLERHLYPTSFSRKWCCGLVGSALIPGVVDVSSPLPSPCSRASTHSITRKPDVRIPSPLPSTSTSSWYPNNAQGFGTESVHFSSRLPPSPVGTSTPKWFAYFSLALSLPIHLPHNHLFFITPPLKNTSLSTSQLYYRHSNFTPFI